MLCSRMFAERAMRWQIAGANGKPQAPLPPPRSAVPRREKGPAAPDGRMPSGKAPADERLRPLARAIRPAVLGDAGRRGRQYGDAVAAARDRPRARRRRHLGGGRVQPVGGRLGGDGAVLGAPRRPARPPRADAARPLRLHRLDADLRRRARRSAWPGWLGADAGVRHLHARPHASTAPSARPRRPRSRPMSPRAPRARQRTNALAALASSFGLGTIIGPAIAPLFIFPPLGLSAPLIVFAGIGAIVLAAIVLRLPDDTPQSAGARADRRLSVDRRRRRRRRPREPDASRRGCAGAIRASCPGT